jgi:hypothetical protein
MSAHCGMGAHANVKWHTASFDDESDTVARSKTTVGFGICAREVI